MQRRSLVHPDAGLLERSADRCALVHPKKLGTDVDGDSNLFDAVQARAIASSDDMESSMGDRDPEGGLHTCMGERKRWSFSRGAKRRARTT